MVDSISITQKHAQPPTWLESATEMVDQTTGVVRYFKTIREMKCKFDPAGILQARGSLPKFLRGSNVKTMTREEVEQSVNALWKKGGFDPLFTHVYQLDLAATLTMPRPVSEYLPILGAASRYRRVPFGNETVLYENATRSISFYDKGKQAGIEGNRLRMEVKIKKKVKGYFKRPVVLADLYDPAFYQLMLGMWLKCYRLIEKEQQHTPQPASTPHLYERQCAIIGQQARGGAAAAIERIDTCPYSSKRKSALRKRARLLASESSSDYSAQLIQELDAAVEQTITNLAK